MSLSRDFIKVAVIGKPHGVKGQVHIKCLLDDPDLLFDLGSLRTENGTEWRIEPVGRNVRLIDSDGVAVSDRDVAARLTNQILYAPKSALPDLEEGEFYHADLVGMRAFGVDGADLGTVKAVHDYGAGSSLELEDGRLVPFTLRCVPEVDMAQKRLTVEFPGEIEVKIPPRSERPADASDDA